jgi:hypothetical protein
MRRDRTRRKNLPAVKGEVLPKHIPWDWPERQPVARHVSRWDVDHHVGEPPPYLPAHAPARGPLTFRDAIAAAVIIGAMVALFAISPLGWLGGLVIGVFAAVVYLVG